jgi:hypothetical protein
MRMLILASLMIAAATSSPHAQTYDPKYPVCLQVYQGFTDYYFECGYTSLAQCNMSAAGRSAQCDVNPYFAHASQEPAARRYKRHRTNY